MTAVGFTDETVSVAVLAIPVVLSVAAITVEPTALTVIAPVVLSTVAVAGVPDVYSTSRTAPLGFGSLAVALTPVVAVSTVLWFNAKSNPVSFGIPPVTFRMF